jgi:hypothetical protein
MMEMGKKSSLYIVYRWQCRFSLFDIVYSQSTRSGDYIYTYEACHQALRKTVVLYDDQSII